MSVVCTRVNERGIFMAADSQVTAGHMIFKDNKTVKLFQSPLGLGVGTVGGAESAALMRIFARGNAPRSSTEDGIVDFVHAFREWVDDHSGAEDDENDWHFAWDGRAWAASGYYVYEITDYHAIGSGAKFAMAALYLGAPAHEAVKVATELDIYCGEPVNTIDFLKETARTQ